MQTLVLNAGSTTLTLSPRRLATVELHTIERLLDAGVLVIAAGGGGVPVLLDDRGDLTGVDAVVDKDLTAALLAERVQAARLVLLTDVPAVQLDHGTRRPIDPRRWSRHPPTVHVHHAEGTPTCASLQPRASPPGRPSARWAR